ncbi:MAG: molybdopterin molybdotransferase MoeA [Candidatus Sericytochromatia bacterium]|nr:molybdopterin molybdotransferase MoeA [Candidatus Sericytochromatia bacterium]
MISVTEAESLIFQELQSTQTETVRLSEAPCAILREDLCADRPLPPYHRVAMDGIGLQFQAWLAGQREFEIAGIQKAGQAQQTLPDPRQCFQVMTGAVLPLGCDTVVPVEEIQSQAGMAQINPALSLQMGAHIHRLGSDATTGQVLLKANSAMLPPQWAVAASIGATQVKVSALPAIALISTGDELVSPEQLPLPHQIRSSNRYFLASALAQNGFHRVSSHHFSDQKQELKNGLATILAEYPFLILSGGVSMGEFDYVPAVLLELGVREVFHKVRQRPGKPLWFGVGPQGQCVFGLPGNPVSAAVCFYRYVLPALWKMEKRDFKIKYAILVDKYQFNKNMTCFLPVLVNYSESGQILASPLPGNGSGDFASLAGSDGFLEMPPGPCEYEVGKAYPLWFWQT